MKREDWIKITIKFFIVAILVIVMLFKLRVLKIKKEQYENIYNNYISPKPFHTGYVENVKHQNVNQCTYNNLVNSDYSGNSRYPVNPVYVYYGNEKPNNCKCLQFIK